MGDGLDVERAERGIGRGEALLLAELVRAGQAVAYVMSDGQRMADIELPERFTGGDIQKAIDLEPVGDGTHRVAEGRWSNVCQPGRGHQDFQVARCT